MPTPVLTRLLLLLVLLPLAAAPASAQTLKLATWNIEWLTLRPTGDPALPPDVHSRAPADFDRLRAYADRLDADVVAFEEVDGPEVAARVFPPDRYVLQFSHDAVVQRTGFAIRRGLAFTANPDLTALDVYPPEARFRLRSGTDITLAIGSARLGILAVHLKTGCREDPLTSSRRAACHTLNQQLAPLQGWIAQRRDASEPFVIMGDFNRWMDGNDPFIAALRQVTPLTRATEGFADPCWGGGAFIDHILVGGAARGWVQPGSMRVLIYGETDPAQKDHLSDHCPVAVQLKMPG